MNRRHALQRLFGGFAAGGLLIHSPLHGQAPPAAAPKPAPQPRPAPGFVIAPAVVQILNEWEKYTRGILKLEGEFDRYVYDSTFLVEKRAVGQFWYEAPDKGRIDFRPMNIAGLKKNTNGQTINELKLGTNGQPYTVVADSSTRWICRGDILLMVDDDQKTFESVEIPPHMRGQNITASPLPFLFGVSAQQMQERYYLALGSMHNPKGDRLDEKGRRLPTAIHMIAAPRLAATAKEWSRAEVLLDPGTKFQDEFKQPIYVPTAIKLLDPAGTSESVYVFRLEDTKLNKSGFWDIGNPFNPPNFLSGYKNLGHHRQAAEPQPQQRDAEVPGRATIQ